MSSIRERVRKYNKIMKLLAEGKKIKVKPELKYVFKGAPIMKFTGQDKQSFDEFEIDCIPLGELETYCVEQSIPMLDEVSVTGYTPEEHHRIQYIYADSSMTQLYAVLDTGVTALFQLSILDVDYFDGEYTGGVRGTEKVSIKFSYIHVDPQTLVAHETLCGDKCTVMEVGKDATPEEIERFVKMYTCNHRLDQYIPTLRATVTSPLLPYPMYITFNK